MVDFKEKTNPLMVAVIAIYLAKNYCVHVCFEGGRINASRAGAWPREAGHICQVKRREENASRFI